MKELIVFPVELRNIETDTGSEIKRKKAVVRTDTNRVISVVSDKYTLIKNEDVLKAVEPVIESVGLKLAQASSCKGGAVSFARFYNEVDTFNKEVKVGDIVKLGIELFNSYDCSRPLGIGLIAERLKCTNGMTVPEALAHFSIRHYGGVDLGEVRDKVAEVLSFSEVVLKRWRTWVKESVDDATAKKFLFKMFGEKRNGQMMFKSYLEKREGNTVWDLYNVLTYYASHEAKVRKPEDLRLKQIGITNRVAEEMNKWWEV